MINNNVDDSAANQSAESDIGETILDEDLQDVSGGGTFGDIYDALNESWTDIKKGFSDAWND